MSKKKYTVGGLFSGVGGLEKAFEMSGYQVTWANEIDKHACKTYKLNHPKHNLFEMDIFDLINKKPFPLKAVDVLVSGFPCQAFSLAGYRKGFEDERGHLFYKILEVINKLSKKPEAIILENVKNLNTHDNGRTRKEIIKELHNLDYSVIWKNYNTSEFTTIPQNRERTVIVCFKNEKDQEDLAPKSRTHFFNYYNITKIPQEKKKGIRSFLDKRVADKYYYKKDTYFYLELQKNVTRNDSVYQWRRKYIRQNKNNEYPTLTANMGTGGHNVPIIKTPKGYRKLTPIECFRLQGQGDIIIPEGLSDAALYKQAGNSVTVDLFIKIAELVRKCLDLHV